MTIEERLVEQMALADSQSLLRLQAEHERDRALEMLEIVEHHRDAVLFKNGELIDQLDKATAALEDTLRRWSEMSQAPPNPLMVMQLARGEVARIVAALAPQPGAEE